MRIEELIIDGFKSYPVRTHVRGFDPSFNAITGLNGSGKSNILDAICFVLGLTNLSSVRAQNIQDLIYKRGQAGVTKASVTIVFDNSDRERAPIAFEQYPTITVTRQIAMGGASKYLINGHKATQQAVQNLFQSVQLNINNPNFLIMQGKITKVLNMKPAEVLALIEEATGTRMFEERKERAFRTMAKKDQKVREITALLQEEITPKLDRLREEKRAFLEYQKAETELERLSRLARAYEWTTTHERLADRLHRGVEHARAQRDEHAAHIETWRRQIASLDAELEALEARRVGSAQDADALARSKALAHELVEATAQRDFRESARADEAQRVADEAAALEAATADSDAHVRALDELRAAFHAFKEEHDAGAARLAEHESLLQSLLTGLSGNDDKNQGGFQGVLARARAAEAEARSEAQQARVRREHAARELQKKAPLAEREAEAARGAHAELEAAQAAAARAAAARDASPFDAEAHAALEASRREAQTELAALVDKHTALQERLPAALQFTYADPTPGFDRTRVKGLVAQLITLDPSRHGFATALETCAGGRLFNVVVEDEQVGSQLLAHGQLRKRVTLIPLSKIRPTCAPPARVAAAQRLAPGRVDLALSLVGYADEVAAALAYVFGNTLVCRDAATAQRVTFDAAVRLKSVTLQGDVYDPAGTLSGGGASHAPSVLLRLHELAQVAAARSACEAALRASDAAWEASAAAAAEAQRLADAAELAAHRAALLQAQMDGGRAASLAADVDAARAAMAELDCAIAGAEERALRAAADVDRAAADAAELGANRDGKVEQVRGTCRSLKEAHAARVAALKQRQTALRSAELAQEQRAMDADAARERLAAARAAEATAAREAEAAAEHVAAVQSRADAADAEVASARAARLAFDDERAALAEAAASKRAALGDAELAVRNVEHELAEYERECAALRAALAALEDAHPWLLEERPRFGQPGTAYDFARHDMDDVRRLCARLEEQQHGMRRKVNPRVMHMMDSVEKKEASLQHMLGTVLRDKSKIEQTIRELDRYKLDALQATYEQVSADFGAIFGELLPGNFARLEPPDGADLTRGLEVRVRLGQTWKQSLAELSGGQRSLIALSLILSLLQYNPAPMYILDEIDAALDLSHTQHIGQLFRTRFKGSQFIVVSLKEGLFSNANVLFRARFRDGTSLVERYAQGEKRAPLARRRVAS